VSADVDERTLREICLRNFQIAIREANPWSVMSAYNKINGVYASENRWLLTDLLRGEWDYDGVVVSDWGAVHDPVETVEAGTDLRMPGRPEDDRPRVAEAAGRLDHQALARVAQRLALLAERTTPDTQHAPVVDLDHHHQLTRRAAAESAVLLVNDGTLPLNRQTTQRLAVIGELARTPRYQGAGSSAVNPTRVVSGLEALTRRAETFGATIEFAPGYTLNAVPPNPGAHRCRTRCGVHR
jgi:beta-glucosidase